MIAWPTTKDIRTGANAGASHLYKGSTLGLETRWRQLWKLLGGTTEGSGVITVFSKSSHSGLALTMVGGIACVHGQIFDFVDDATIALPAFTDATVSRVWLQTNVDVDFDILSTSWVVHDDTTIVDNAVCVGQCRAHSGEVKDWYPWTYNGVTRKVTGSFDTRDSPTAETKLMVLGFRPLSLTINYSAGSGAMTIQDYGFSCADNLSAGTFEAEF